jgi:hypothetical protein
VLSVLVALPHAASAKGEFDDFGDDSHIERQADDSVKEAVERRKKVQLPISYALQPLTLTAGTIRAEMDYDATQFSQVVVSLHRTETDSKIDLAAHYGITDDFEAFLLAVPLAISPDVQYGNPEIGALVRFVRGDVELGAKAGVFFPALAGTKVSFELGVPLLIRFAGIGRIDTGVSLLLAATSPLSKAVAIPILASVNLMEQLFVRLETGVLLEPDLDKAHNVSLPLGLAIHYTIPSRSGPLLELGPSFSFPEFLAPGNSAKTVITDNWQFGFSLRGFVYL